MYISDGVGERLREERERLSLSQTDFGALGSVSRGTQKAYEQESNSPDLRYLAALEKAGVDVQYVLSGVKTCVSEEGLSAVESKILESYRSLSEGDQASVVRLTGALAAMSSM